MHCMQSPVMHCMHSRDGAEPLAVLAYIAGTGSSIGGGWISGPSGPGKSVPGGLGGGCGGMEGGTGSGAVCAYIIR
jgi:hypothetical protein